MKTLEIVFKYNKIDTKEVRECIEFVLGVEIVEINEVDNDRPTISKKEAKQLLKCIETQIDIEEDTISYESISQKLTRLLK